MSFSSTTYVVSGDGELTSKLPRIEGHDAVVLEPLPEHFEMVSKNN